MPQMKSAAPDGHRASSAQSSHNLKSTSTAPPINRFLDASESATGHKARKSGSGWRIPCACCGTASYKVSVSEAANGMCLVHPFCEHDAHELVEAVGMRMSDLFPDSARPLTPQERREWRGRQKSAGWAAALRVLDHEALVLLVLANDLDAGPLDKSGRKRLRLAVSRIKSTRETLA